MKEFKLNSAERYKDGSPMMTDLPVQLVRLMKRIAYLEKKVGNDEIGQYTAHSLKEYIDVALSEEMEAAAKEFGKFKTDVTETMITHNEQFRKISLEDADRDDRIEICEGNIENLDYRLEEIERKMANIIVALRYADLDYFKATIEPDNWHTGKDFCGNCAHCDSGKQGDDTIYVCDRTAEIIDPDEASCPHYEEAWDKPDREECKHCPKSQCDNCMNFPF